MTQITFAQFIKESNDGYSFFDVINNLTESQIEDAAEEYFRARLKIIIDQNL